MLEFAKRAEEHVKGMVTPGTLFEEFGFNYIGPIDGHDLDVLVATLHEHPQAGGPAVPARGHAQGQGLQAAEDDPMLYHGVSKFDPDERHRSRKPQASRPIPRSSATGCATWRRTTAAWSASRRPCARARAWCASRRNIPERYFDVGIAEQHAVTFAAGLACEGMKPVVAIYSTFLQRAYDQLIHDVAIQNLPVMLAIDRGGLVGADGATHTAPSICPILRCIPNMMVMAPSDENECRQMLYTAFQLDQPELRCAIRAAPARA